MKKYLLTIWEKTDPFNFNMNHINVVFTDPEKADIIEDIMTDHDMRVTREVVNEKHLTD